MSCISKSKYLNFVVCPKKYWLSCHNPEVATINEMNESLKLQGHEVGEMALRLFDQVANVKRLKPDGSLDIGEMLNCTQDLVLSNCPAIAEASFSNKDVFCSVDILKNNFDGSWDIYEVKASKENKPEYYLDIAFQKYVLTECGVFVRQCYLVTLNGKYVRSGEIEPDKLFIKEEVSNELDKYIVDIAANVAEAQSIHALSQLDFELSKSCTGCDFFAHCTKALDKPNIFERYNFRKKIEWYKEGVVTFLDIWNKKNKLEKLTDIQYRQIEHCIHTLPIYIDKVGLQAFLDNIKFPIYFLDFETLSTAIPLIDGISPYEKLLVQYSIHILYKGQDTLEHKEFLADESNISLRLLAEKLVADIPLDKGSILCYNAGFEKGVIKAMAARFSDLQAPLMNICTRIIDLLKVFRQGYVYNKEMGGSFSLKSVLPALIPNNPALSYALLDAVHNGVDAMQAFLSLNQLPKEDRVPLRESLKKYCALDTLAMAVIYQELCSMLV